MAQKQPLEVVVSLAARAEWIAIWQWTATQFSEKQADAYIHFLEIELGKIALTPELGSVLPEYPNVRRKLVKKRSGGHGQILFYRVSEARLELLHIFHMAQDWQSKLRDS